jgi:hypothetical protein
LLKRAHEGPFLGEAILLLQPSFDDVGAVLLSTLSRKREKGTGKGDRGKGDRFIIG